MKVYILTAIDTICNQGLEIFGVFPSRERAEVAMEADFDMSPDYSDLSVKEGTPIVVMGYGCY